MVPLESAAPPNTADDDSSPNPVHPEPARDTARDTTTDEVPAPPPTTHPAEKPMVELPALELLTEDKTSEPPSAKGLASSLSASPVPFEEEEVESGHIVATEPQPIIPEHPRTNSLPPLLTSDEAAATNDVDSRGPFDPMSYSLAPNGRLLESKEEWERRPRMTVLPSGEFVYRPLRMQCTHCDEAYTKTSDLYAHIRTHQRHTECPHCEKSLTCMATFVYHVRTHTMEKPYYCPCDDCEFQNAVKYNLKVHLASIRHGGKSNLAKYAKVLDLDVCDKSMRKRKDDSVHRLGSRRTKKRRKLNNGSSRRARAERRDIHHLHHSQYAQSMAVYPQYYGQEEYDQLASQLLFSLSAHQQSAGAVAPQIYDPATAMTMDWAQNVAAIGQNVVGQNGEYGAAMNPGDQQLVVPMQLKPEQLFEPNNYAYYGYAQCNAVPSPYAQMNTLDVAVDPNDNGAAKLLTSKDSSGKVSNLSIGTASNCTPKEADPQKAGKQNSAGTDSADGSRPQQQSERTAAQPTSEQNVHFAQKQEAGAVVAGGQPLFGNYDVMAQQNPAMVMAQDPMVMMQPLPQFEAHPMAPQYMMAAPTYYPAANGFYGQMMYSDAAMAQQTAHCDRENEKKIEAPPLPTNIQFMATAESNHAE